MNVAIGISEWQGDDISSSGYHCPERAVSPVFKPVALLEWSNHRLTIWTKCDVRKWGGNGRTAFPPDSPRSAFRQERDAEGT